jgi:hypothetical protein
LWGFANRGPLLWINGTSSHVNLISDLMIGNSLVTNTVFEATSISAGGQWTFASALPLSTGDHVELRTTGTLPTPFTDTTLYYVYRVSSNVFGLHTDMTQAINGVYLTATGGSGTQKFTIGPASAVYLSGGAQNNDFVGIRSDQNSGPAITFRDAYYNTVSGGLLSANYAPVNGETADASEAVGVSFEKGAVGNQVVNLSVRQSNYSHRFIDNSQSNLVLLAASTTLITNGVLNTSSANNVEFVLKSTKGGVVIGNANTPTALTLVGNISGDRVFKGYRDGVGYFGIGVAPLGITFYNETNGVSIGQWYANSTDVTLQLGTGGTTARNSLIIGEQETGTDATGGFVKIHSGLGTGNGTPAAIEFYVARTNGISNATGQTYVQRLKIDSGGTTLADRLNLYSVTSDPPNLVDGSIWYRSDNDHEYIMANGVTYQNIIGLVGSATWDIPSLSTLANSSTTIAVTGAVVGDMVVVSPPMPSIGVLVSGEVSSPGTITIRSHNMTSGTIDPPSATYKVKVIKQ